MAVAAIKHAKNRAAAKERAAREERADRAEDFRRQNTISSSFNYGADDDDEEEGGAQIPRAGTDLAAAVKRTLSDQPPCIHDHVRSSCNSYLNHRR